MKLFTDAELEIISQRNSEELGELRHLTAIELLQLKAGENVTLGAVVRARAILSAHYDGRLKTGGYVSQAEMAILVEEHNNLATKMMLIFDALVRRGVITEQDLFDEAAKLRGDTDGTGEADTGKQDGTGTKAPRRSTEGKVRQATSRGFALGRKPSNVSSSPKKSRKAQSR